MQAGLYRLKHLGITRLILPTSISSAMSQLPDEAIALAAASHIERELQITPWSLSSNFVACTSQVTVIFCTFIELMSSRKFGLNIGTWYSYERLFMNSCD